MKMLLLFLSHHRATPHCHAHLIERHSHKMRYLAALLIIIQKVTMVVRQKTLLQIKFINLQDQAMCRQYRAQQEMVNYANPN